MKAAGGRGRGRLDELIEAEVMDVDGERTPADAAETVRRIELEGRASGEWGWNEKEVGGK